jgi:hypothetical protein
VGILDLGCGVCADLLALRTQTDVIWQLRQPLPLDSDIPDHSAFPAYAPSFVLNVPAGNARDENTEEYLKTVEVLFAEVCTAIKGKMQPFKDTQPGKY